MVWALISYLLPFPILCQALSLLTKLSSASLGTAIPVGAAAEKQGLCPQKARGLTPCVPGPRSPQGPLPRHLSRDPQPKVSAAVAASHWAWQASGEGRWLAEKWDREKGGWQVVGWGRLHSSCWLSSSHFSCPPGLSSSLVSFLQSTGAQSVRHALSTSPTQLPSP